MENITVRIQRFEDKDKPLFPELKGKTMSYAIARFAAVLEKGTGSGNTSVQLIAETEDGEILVIETTAKLLNMVNNIAQANSQMWGDIID